MPEYYQPKRRKRSPSVPVQSSADPSANARQSKTENKRYTQTQNKNIIEQKNKSAEKKKKNKAKPPDIKNKTYEKEKKNNVKKKNKSRKKKYVAPPVSPYREQVDDDLKLLKEKKQRRKRNYIYYYIMLAATAIIVVGILSVTVLFKVTQMLIEGECKYTVQELKIAGGIEEEENLIRIDARAAEEAILKKLVYIDSVKVRKDFPSTITFVVSNAVPEAELLSGGKYYSISSKGRILQEKTNHEKNLVVFEGMDPSVLPETGGYIDFDDPEGGKLIKILMENIKESGLKEVKSVNIKDRMDIIINYADRVMMRIGSTVQLSEKLSAAKILITNEIDQNEHVMLLLNNPEKVASRSLNSMSDEIKTQAQTSETIEDSEENYENTESAETQQPVTE